MKLTKIAPGYYTATVDGITFHASREVTPYGDRMWIIDRSDMGVVYQVATLAGVAATITKIVGRG